MLKGIRATWPETLIVLFIVLLLFAIGTPNLLRSRISADMAARYGHMYSASKSVEAANEQEMSQPGSMVSRTVQIRLQTEDASTMPAKLSSLAVALHGYVQNSKTERVVSDDDSGSVTLRVPAGQLDQAREQIRRLASGILSEQIDTRDVTRESVDQAAELRNLRAEEMQYLTIMKRSNTVKDTLSVEERLSAVRGRIDKLQAEARSLSQQVEMATIQIDYFRAAHVDEAGVRWHPWINARNSFRDTVQGLANFADGLISFLLWLPIGILWAVTLLSGVFVALRLFRFVIKVGKLALGVQRKATSEA